MTIQEFSTEFDTLINAFNERTKGLLNQSLQPLALDEYEKSVFLTKAQEELVLSLYTGKNQFGDSFEKNEELRKYLNTLIKTAVITEQAASPQEGMSLDSKFFELPSDSWFLTYEVIKVSSDDPCINNKELTVIPISQDEYFKVKENPFRQNNNRRALRLDWGNNIVEIVTEHTIARYLVRYLTKPTPIILVDLPETLTINNENTAQGCMLHPVIHRQILERAIQLALASRSIGRVTQ